MQRLVKDWLILGLESTGRLGAEIRGSMGRHQEKDSPRRIVIIVQLGVAPSVLLDAATELAREAEGGGGSKEGDRRGDRDRRISKVLREEICNGDDLITGVVNVLAKATGPTAPEEWVATFARTAGSS